MLVATCNRLFQIGRETRTIEIDDSIVRRYSSDTERDRESYTEVCDVCLSRPIILDVQACPILTRAHLDRGTLSRVMRHRNTSSHWLRVLSSEAVLNPFPPVPNFFPTNTELDEFRILRGQSFEPVDCDGILKIGRKLGIGTSGGAAGFQAGAAPILTGSSGHLSGPLNERIGEGGHVRFYCDSRLNADVARGPKSAKGLNRSRGRALRRAAWACR
jgi:hypothetical protein